MAHAKQAAKQSVFSGQLINILTSVDTGTILANPDVDANLVIFMADNNAGGGSTGEGTDELTTACHVGDTIQWRVTAQDLATPVDFLAFKNSNGDVFGFNPPGGDSNMYQAEATSTGTETYQIKILINNNVTYTWDPHVICS